MSFLFIIFYTEPIDYLIQQNRKDLAVLFYNAARGILAEHNQYDHDKKEGEPKTILPGHQVNHETFDEEE